MKAPPPPPNPAKGTSLESESKVIDVFVMCNWPDPRSPDAWGGSGLRSLKGTSQIMTKPVTMPADMVTNTCTKDPHNCEQLITPSRYSTAEKSADLRITRPTSDGGEAEVVVVFSP